jgi:hypothetical protein
MDDLVRHDPGQGVQWVVGFLSSTPKGATDFHKLGYARYFSKHLIVRSSTDPREMAHLERFAGLNEAEREELYSERKQHRLVTLLLHELAHTLGAIHRTARDTIMSPTYDPDEKGFDDATLGVLRITLPAQVDESLRAPALAVLATYLDANTEGWVGSERTEMMGTLAAAGRRASTTSPPPETGAALPPASAPAEAPLPITTLSPPDRALHDSAMAAEGRDPREAWSTAQPLFERYPRVVEVQELRCRLAKARKFFAGVVEAHCERLQALSAGAGGR